MAEAHPILYEINTRCWLRDLSAAHGRNITLGNVPDAEFLRWRKLGFTHLWLMGVWTTGPRSRALALSEPNLLRACDALLPDWRDTDVGGSPYAIAEYKVPRALGGETGLTGFRRKLHEHGLKLVLDFVPNHVGIDHPWLREQPELFVQSPTEREGTFAQETATGVRWIAHGRDPWFPPWVDTAQLDYRRAATRAAMFETLRSVAARCDGVRCDMAMLLLNDVFEQTWRAFPCPGERLRREFWEEAIPSVRREQRDFLFLAEVYWDLEARLQELGFDFTYDKPLYDALVWRNAAGAQWRVLSAGPGFVSRCAHFIENHDEARIAAQLSLAEHRAAALVVMGLPGMRFLHEGQLTGARLHVPVQLARRPPEPPDRDITRFYEHLLTTLPQTAVGRGDPRILTPRAAWAENPTGQNFILVQWHLAPPEFDLVAVNLAPHRSQCYAPLTVSGLSEHNWRLRDLLGSEVHERYGDDLATQGLYLDLPPHGAQLFHFEPLT